MGERLWGKNDLARFLRYEDPEVRYWAVERLARHFPEAATPLIAPYLFDEHELTPELVAVHLGRHGGAEQVPLLLRGVKSLRGLPSARALEALVRRGAPGAIDQVRAAYDRRDFDEECWSSIAEALAESDLPPARQELRNFLSKRADWFGLPAILRSALKIAGPGEYRPLLMAWIRSLQWRGAGVDDTGESFRTLMDHLEIDDCGWVFRTNLKGRIDFARTVKAVESSYDCSIRSVLGEETSRRIGEVLETGAYDAIAETLSRVVRERAAAVKAGGDDLAERIVEVVDCWTGPEARAAIEGLGPHLRDWVIGFLLAAVFKMARYRSFALEVERAAGNLEALLPLLEVETSAMLETLPGAIADVVEAAGDDEPRLRRLVEERCLAILAARGPFFPQVMALETLGALRSPGAINEIIDFLGEDNSYLYESAEHALSHMEGDLVGPARARMESGNVDEETAHSLLILLAELGTPEALRVVVDHLDAFVEAAGPGDAARWVSLFGARELIDPLRRLLSQDVPMVGQGVLLLAAIHNARVPEENAIRRAIDEYFKQPPGGEGGGSPPADGSDKYVM